MSSKDQEVIEYIDRCFGEYTTSHIYQNWKLLCENILDAIDQKYRPGEQLTRQGMYFAVMRAQRDGWIDGLLDLFGQAKPLFIYKPRRDVPPELVDRCQEVLADIWKDIGGLEKFMALCRDAVDYSMAIAYTKYSHHYAESEAPTVKATEWGEQLEWSEEFDVVADTPDFDRVHPFNYRCAMSGAKVPKWEGIEWEWTIGDLQGMIGDDKYNQSAVKRLIVLMQKGEIGQGTGDFYSAPKERGGEAAQGMKVYAREYWGPLSECESYRKDKCEYVVVKCEGEILRMQRNKLRIGGNTWRPIKRMRFDPMNDLPYGGHVLAATLPHQRQKNLMLNLASDDVVIRQHLGLAAWRGALENPNQLLNPEGAREPIWMRHDMGADKLPRFFADQSSGVLRDAIQFDTQVTERDMQIAGLPFQALGMGGGAQGKTATEQTYLANGATRKVRGAVINGIETGLEPICKDLLGLLLRNNAPEDLRLSPMEQVQIFNNNFFDFETSLTTNMQAQSMALAQWGQSAMQKMSEITPASNPGSADHIVRYLKDMGKAMGLPASSVDSYLPDAAPKPQATPPAGPGMAPPGMPAQGQSMPQEMAQPEQEVTNVV